MKGRNMFWKKKAEAASNEPRDQKSRAIDAMHAAIDARAGENPFVRAEVTGLDLLAALTESYRDENGLRLELALAALGSVAGACAAAAVLSGLRDGRLTASAPDVVVLGLKSGGQVLAGDFINRRLYSGETIHGQNLSLLRMMAGVASELGRPLDFDLHDLVRRSLDRDGHPDLSGLADPGATPQMFVEALMPDMPTILNRYGLPDTEHFLAPAAAASQLIRDGKDVVPPDAAARLVMEYAAFASKLEISSFAVPRRAA